MKVYADYELRRTYAVSGEAVQEILDEQGLEPTEANILDAIRALEEDLDYNRAALTVIGYHANGNKGKVLY